MVIGTRRKNAQASDSGIGLFLVLIFCNLAGTKGSAMGFIMGRDLQMPFAQRLFLDPIVQAGYFQDADIYINGKEKFSDERTGSNDSDKDNKLESDGWDNFIRLRFKYLLPIGHGKDQIISTQVVDQGPDIGAR